MTDTADIPSQGEDEPAPPPTKKKRRRVRRVVVVLVLLAGIGSLLAALIVWAPGAWIRREASPWVYATYRSVPVKTVAIVPGAHVNPNGTPSSVLEDRLETARQLYRRGKVRKVLVSGDNRTRYYNEPMAMRRWLIRNGVAPEDVFADFAGLRTFDTMVRAAEVFQVDDAVICTQAFHLYRGVFLAREAGIDAVGLISDRRRYRRGTRDRSREYFARTLAFFDVHVLGTEPRHLGPPVPIDGPPQL